MLARTMERVLVIGAGLTGAAATAKLSQNLPKETKICLWDKSRGVGGRMSTSRGDAGATLDLGAQYISASPDYYKSHHREYEDLQQAGLLQPMRCAMEESRSYPEGTKHFVTPQGISSVVKYFINQSKDVTVGTGKTLKDLSLEEKQWTVTTQEGDKDNFDCVILTMPVPQIQQLAGNIRNVIENNQEVKRNLDAVSYSTRFAVGLFFSPGTQLDLPWDVKYFSDNPCIRYVSVDNKKREHDCAAPTIVVHTSVPFGLKHLEEDKDVVGPIIQQHLRDLIPGLPEPASVKNIKWRYSQVHKSYLGQPGCVVLHQEPLLILAGDAFAHSGFDGCLDSAEKTAGTVLQHCRL